MKIKVEIEKREHKGYTEYSDAIKKGLKIKGLKITKHFGKYQFLYKYENCIISLVKLNDYFNHNWFWEIHCLEGKLFEDTEKFKTKLEAHKRIIDIFKHAIFNKL